MVGASFKPEKIEKGYTSIVRTRNIKALASSRIQNTWTLRVDHFC